MQTCFHLREDSLQRAYNKFTTQGVDAFFGKEGRKGKVYKILSPNEKNIQHKFNPGQSINSIAKEDIVAESTIRYGIKQGYLKKETVLAPLSPDVSTSGPNERTILDITSPLGIATTRFEERIALARGGCGNAQPVFDTETYEIPFIEIVWKNY